MGDENKLQPGSIVFGPIDSRLPTRTEHGRPLKYREAVRLRDAIREERARMIIPLDEDSTDIAIATGLLREAGIVPTEGESEIVELAMSAVRVIAVLQRETVEMAAEIDRLSD